MSKPEVLAWLWMAYGKQVTVDPGGAEKLITDGETVEPLIRLTDHEASRAADKARIAELEKSLQAAQDRYFREVYGLNNEGDPIGGDPPAGYANISARIQDQVSALRTERNELLALLRDVQDDLFRRGEKDSDGCKVVNLGNGLWCRIDATLARLGKEGE